MREQSALKGSHLESWLTSRRGTLPKINELESINVAKTCERLRLAITQSRNGLQRTLDLTHKHQLEALSFRSISGLCYTTLRVHELQIDQKPWWPRAEIGPQYRQESEGSIFKPSRPSTCSASYRSKRKRRRTIEYSMQDISTTNYSQLLDETENFVEWGKIDEYMTKANGHSRTTCIHIREITINEVDIQNERYSMDEDEGFGNATAEEMTTLVQLLSDTSAATVKEAKAQKRKALEMSTIREKRAKCAEDSAHDVSRSGLEYSKIEIPRSADARGNDMVDNFIPAMASNPSQESFAQESPGYMQTDALSITEMNIAEKTKEKSCDAANNTSFDVAIEINEPFENCDTAKEIANETNITCNFNQNCVASSKSTNKVRKIIMDQRIELTETEMRTQLQTKINFRAKLRKARAKVNWIPKRHLPSEKSYEMILPSANKLLTTLSRNCVTMRNFKRKNHVTRRSLDNSRISAAYRSLIREILQCEVTDELATQIYKNWNNGEKHKSINRRQRLPTPVPEDIHQAIIEPNNGMGSAVINLNNNLELPVDTCSQSDDQDEWGAFDVMVKLLNLWRSKNVLGDEIPVEYLLQPAILIRKKAAKAFAALLKLAASRFIVLLSAENSIQLHHIKLGAASSKLIQRNEANGMPLRRANIGYRIHAN
ncbi:PREDICTED: uncharacterized protein LOC108357973 isoform X4 [Rhagoletis zephyria]|uniref:uncharacterized protein LOC108357973 isoform X4 n=1 Tax=Rhagoletis zephyria TaxID=28612 RepID=UPI00081199F6|nr:PREDICTED: uncharacterized protein LOC108357973 isoform X4 [Rhagoletis zephyria]